MWHFSYFENEKIQKRYLNIILNDYESNYETLLCNSDYTTMKIKNHTHVKKVGHTSEFPFGIYWWTLKNLKNQNFEKMKKNCWRYHHFTHVYQKPQSYEVQFLRYRVRQICFVILDNFLPFHPPPPTPFHCNNSENQNFEKMKKASGDVIILNLCNKKHNQMMYAYSDMECDRHNFLSF